MDAIKTERNQPIPGADLQLAQWEGVRNRLDHLDTQVHALDQKLTQLLDFIAEHKPALDRGMALLDPGAGIRKALGRKPR